MGSAGAEVRGGPTGRLAPVAAGASAADGDGDGPSGSEPAPRGAAPSSPRGDAAGSGAGRRPGMGSSTPRNRMLARIARPISTGKHSSAAKASRESATREREPKAETSAVPRVSAAKSAAEVPDPISASTHSASTRL